MISLSIDAVGDAGGHWISFLRIGDCEVPKAALREVGGDGDGFHCMRRPVSGDCGVVRPLRYSSSFWGGQTHRLPVPESRTAAGLNPVLGRSVTVDFFGGQADPARMLVAGDGDLGLRNCSGDGGGGQLGLGGAAGGALYVMGVPDVELFSKIFSRIMCALGGDPTPLMWLA